MYPELTLNGITISTFPLTIALGLNVSLLLGWLLTRKYRILSTAQFIFFWLFVATGYGIGGRLGHEILYNHLGDTGIEGGSSVLGAIALLIVGVPLYARLIRRDWRTLSGLAAYGLLSTQIVGKLGCFLAGCCHGVPGDLPWCMIPAEGSESYPTGVSLHPTQLYELTVFILLFVLLSRLIGKKRGPDGTIAAWYLTIYGVERFLVEFVRGDTAPGIAGLTAGQIVALLITLIGSLLFIAASKREATIIAPTLDPEHT